MGTTGVFLLFSCVTVPVATPQWRSSAFPDWSMRLPTTLGTSPLDACSSAAAAMQCSGQVGAVISAWILNDERWAVIAALSPVCSECVSWILHCSGSPPCQSRHPCRSSVCQVATSHISSTCVTWTTIGMRIVCGSGSSWPTRTSWRVLLGRGDCS